MPVTTQRERVRPGARFPAAAALWISLLAAGCSGEPGAADRSIGEAGLGPVVSDLVAELAALAEERDRPTAYRLDPEGRIHLPVGERVDTYLRLDRPTRLVIERLEARGEGEPFVWVTLQGVGAEETLLTRFRPSPGPVEVELPAAAGGVGRLSLVAGSVSASSGGITLWRPRLHAAEASPVATGTGRGASADELPPNIVIYLVDTLRADHLGAYGYPLPVSPHLDRFAGRATLFEQAIAHSPWTRTSVASLFTGLEPHVHGVNHREDMLPPEALTLAELLSAAGYHTAAVTTNGNAGPNFGFDQGFDYFSRSRKLRFRADQLTRRLFDFIDREGLTEPFFLFVHTMDPHAPYTPPEPFRSRFVGTAAGDLGQTEVLKGLKKAGRAVSEADRRRVLALYDAEIASNDHEFGRLLDRLRELGVYDRSLIVFLSDHGEEFWEHGGWGHGHSLHRELLETPLVIKAPGQQTGLRVPELVQHVDLLPTLLDYAGVDSPGGLPGHSLRPVMEGAAGPWRAVYSHLALDGRRAVSLTAPDWKLIVRGKRLRWRHRRLFDRRADRPEAIEVDEGDPVRLGYLRQQLDLRRAERHGRSLETVTTEIGPELANELRALGYLE